MSRWRTLPRGLFLGVLAALVAIPPGRGGAVTFGADEHEHDFASRKGGRDAFDSIGRIECPDPASPGNWFSTTGWLIGSNQTLITAAHAFYRAPATARRGPPVILDPRTCRFILFGRDQKPRSNFAIRYAISPWADPRQRYDVSYDVAIARLSRPVTGAVIPVARPAHDVAGSSISLYAFHASRTEARLLHESQGIIGRFGGDRERLALARHFGLRISHPDLLLLASANTMQGASGGMYFSQTWQAAIGIHLGHLCQSYRGPGSFNARSCFNYGKFISPEVLRLVAGVRIDRPDRPYLIRAEDD